VASWWDRITGRQDRSLWARTDGDLLVNDPNQQVWLGSDQWPAVLQRFVLQNGGSPATPEQLPVTTRATALITAPLTASPFLVVDDETGEKAPTPRWLSDPMLLRPDARLVDGLQAFPHARRLTRSGFWREVIRSAVWYGQGAFVYMVGSDGAPVAGTLRQVNPATLAVNEQSRWVMGSGEDKVTFDRDGYLDLGPATYRIAVMRNPLSPVGADGLSLGVFGLAPSAFETAAAVDVYTRGTFKSGVPSGYLKVNNPSFTQPQADELKRKWMESHGGDSRSVAVLNSTTDFQPISFTPVDAEAVAIKRMAIGDVAMAFGLPPEVLGVSLANSSTYTNIGDQWSRLKAFGLSSWLAEAEDVLSSLVPWGRSVRVDTSEFEAASTVDGASAVPEPQPAAGPDPEQQTQEEETD
jgi:hypothetical protein